MVCASTSGVSDNGTDSKVNKSVCVFRYKPNVVNVLLLKSKKNDMIY